ncbi:MAG: 50S ribosomal protein L19 [Deltaproteobacteria bacterium]|nr:50S ribosomal protein L19 [Deltaproteobacteria bacterium]
MGIIESIEKDYLRTDIPELRIGDTARVNVRIKEGEKERVQQFEGIVISKRGSGLKATFTVRKVSYGIGVERTFPLHSPALETIKVISHGQVRRAKLYYIRNLKGKAARIKEKV